MGDPRQRCLGVTDQIADKIGGRPDVGDQVNRLAGPDRDRRQFTPVHRLLIRLPGRAVVGELLIPAAPLLSERMAYSLGMRALNVRGKTLAVVALAALVSAVGGCGSGGGPTADGPLNSGLSIHGPIPRGSVCAPGGQTWAFGLQSFTNYGKTTLVVDRVVLLHPRDEHLVGSYAVPGNRVLGVVHWPVRNPQTQPAWKDRRPGRGFRLAQGKSFNMVLGIAAIPGGRRAISQGMLVYYHDSSGTYVAKNFYANIIAAKTQICE